VDGRLVVRDTNWVYSALIDDLDMVGETTLGFVNVGLKH